MARSFCAILLGLAAATPLAAQPVILDVSGEIWDGVYSSPDGTFQLGVPLLLMPGARIGDEISADGITEIWFGDDLCREFRLRRTPIDPPLTAAPELKRLARERIVPAWRSRYGARSEGRISDLRLERGIAVQVDFRIQNACSVWTGQGAMAEVPGRLLLYVFVDGNALSRRPSSPGIWTVTCTTSCPRPDGRRRNYCSVSSPDFRRDPGHIHQGRPVPPTHRSTYGPLKSWREHSTAAHPRRRMPPPHRWSQRPGASRHRRCLRWRADGTRKVGPTKPASGSWPAASGRGWMPRHATRRRRAMPRTTYSSEARWSVTCLRTRTAWTRS
jgi:hypothetical protein